MEQYVPEFSAKDVDGQELLQMDGNKLKVRMRRTTLVRFIRNSEQRFCLLLFLCKCWII